MSEYNTVAAYFPSLASAESAVTALKEAGFQQTELGVASNRSATGSNSLEDTAYTAGHKAGGAWDKMKAFFGGNAAEPYAGEASGETFNDSVISPEEYESEDLHGSLSGLSVPEEHSRYFGHRLSTSSEGAIVTVTAKEREVEALEILKMHGGDLGHDASEYDQAAVSSTPATAQNLNLYGEVLRVHKDRVSRGEVRIRKEVITTTQTIEVPVTREELVVERVPVTGNQVATGTAFSGEEVRIPLNEERAVVSKEAVVREQVRIGKKDVTNVETFDEKVRSEELKVGDLTQDVTGKSA